MSNFVIQVHKHGNSNKAPAIQLPANLPQQELSAPDLIKVARDLFEANGVLLIDNLFSQDLIAKLYQSFVERYRFYFEDKDYAGALKVGDKRRMLTVDFQLPFSHPNLYANPFLLYLMRALLGSGFVLGSLGAVIALPGAEAQHIHRDHPHLFEDEGLAIDLPSFAITVVVPLIALTPETGSTRVWKGSHRTTYPEEYDMQDSFVPFLPTGSCYLMDYQLLHGGTPNLSNLVRPILYIAYYRSWFQEAVNYEKQARISITKQEYQKIPEKYQFLFERVRDSAGSYSFPEVKKSEVKASEVKALETEKLEVEKHDRQADKVFNELTATDQAIRLGKIAKKSLENYGLKQAQVTLISHGENTVFSVITSDLSSGDQSHSPYLSDRFILRIHRANYLSVDAIESELCWLRSLRREAGLPVPEPIPTVEGKLCVLAHSPDFPEPRACSLTRWVHGRLLTDEASSEQLLQHVQSAGRLLGQLHRHAANWSIPANFTRPSWNWNGLFGDGAGYGNNGALVWELTPQPYRRLFQGVSKQVKAMMASLSEEKDQFGLIHGDFWLGNLLVCDREIRPIDFADCGFGYWGYDFARFLNDFAYSRDFSSYLDNLLEGYTQIQAFPERQLSSLNTFIVAQHVALALWRVNRAQDHPDFRATLAADLQETAEEIELFLAT